MSDFRLLSITELVEPEHAARTTMDDERMNSLVVSIREVGILEPLLVMPSSNGTFEVVAGHRRLKAARIAGLGEVPVIVTDDPELADAVKIHENVEREELSPADEAIFYAELYERHGEDTDLVAARVKRSRDHVEGRLNLIRGDKHVFDALARGKISIGVAGELNKFVSEDKRLFHLDYCIRTGATVAVARQWRTNANALAELEAKERSAPNSSSPPTPEDEAARARDAHAFAGAAPWELSSSKELRPCKFCGQQHVEWKMLRIYVCVPCNEQVLPPILRAFGDREP